jgi:hypothetical protein
MRGVHGLLLCDDGFVTMEGARFVVIQCRVTTLCSVRDVMHAGLVLASEFIEGRASWNVCSCKMDRFVEWYEIVLV